MKIAESIRERPPERFSGDVKQSVIVALRTRREPQSTPSAPGPEGAEARLSLIEEQLRANPFGNPSALSRPSF